MNYVFVLALGIGIVAGLRSLTAPAVVAMVGAPRLVESARLAACVHGINGGGGDIFPACDWRIGRGQTADHSETDCACAIISARYHRRSLRRVSLRSGREIVNCRSASGWNRRCDRRFCRLRSEATFGEQIFAFTTLWSRFAKICSLSVWDFSCVALTVKFHANIRSGLIPSGRPVFNVSPWRTLRKKPARPRCDRSGRRRCRSICASSPRAQMHGPCSRAI